MADALPPITEDEFRRLADFLYRRTGMVFTETKRYYVERRISERIAATSSQSFAGYFAYLRSEIRDEVEQLINAFTVNETYFYREDHQLACLSADLLKERVVAKKPGDSIRIWSVPCSTGEEPYSIAIWLLENSRRPLQTVRGWRLLGSSIPMQLRCRMWLRWERFQRRLRCDEATWISSII